MITIDGSQGEGGGQILRTSLALSLVTGQPFRMERIRAKRQKPGLLKQHLTAVEAAKTVGCAEADGASLSSQTLEFRPGPVTPGNYRFAVGTAGSATLVLQTVLPALLTASGHSTLTLEGGTHNPMAPPFDFLARCFLPLIRRMGPSVELELRRHGFFPAGGGQLHAALTPTSPRMGSPTVRRPAIGRNWLSHRLLTSGFPKQQRRSDKQHGEKRIPSKPPPFRRCPRGHLRISSNQHNQHDRQDQRLSERGGEQGAPSHLAASALGRLQ